MNVNTDFSAILTKRYETAREDMQRMNNIKAELDFNKLLQEELTQKPIDDEEEKPTTIIDWNLQALSKKD